MTLDLEQPQLLGFLEPELGSKLVCGAYRLRRFRAVRRRLLEEALKAPMPPAPRGRALRLLGRDAEARGCFAQAQRADPGCAAAHAWLWELERDGKPRAGRRGLERAVALEPENARWKAMRGADSLVTGRAGEARKDLESAVALEPGFALAQALLGRLLAIRGDLRGAQKHLDAALASAPAVSWFRRERAAVRARRGDRAGALEDLDRMMLLEDASDHFVLLERGKPPREPEAWRLVLRASPRATGDNDYSLALADLERVVALKPEWAWAWAYLGRARGLAKAAEAAAALDEGLRRAPECGWMRGWRGEQRRQAGDYAGALEDLDRALELDPFCTMAYIARGGARRMAGRLDEAMQDLDVAAELEPGYGWVFQERTMLRRAQCRPGEALKELRAAHRLDPKFVWERSDEKLPAALKELDAAAAADPSDAQARAWRADARLRLGDSAGALRDIERAIAIGGGDVWFYLLRGRLRAERGERSLALSDFRKASALDPSDPKPFFERARLLLDRGQLRPALGVLSEGVRTAHSPGLLLTMKGQVELLLGLDRRALADFDAALALAAPSFSAAFDALVGRSVLRHKRGDAAGAAADLDIALRLRPDSEQALALRRLLVN